MKLGYHVCSECGREMERCRAATVDQNGHIEWVCRQCWRDLYYDKYLYGHRLKEAE